MSSPSATPRMPVLFVPHGGGPWPFVQDGALGPPGGYAGLRSYLEPMVSGLAVRPSTLLVVSAHWEAPEPTLMSAARPPMLYDYSGFPPHTYQVQWPAPGAPEVAAEARERLEQAGIPSRLDPERGFDHGTFVPLSLSVPLADIPTTQLSLKAGLHPRQHLEIGRALAPLRSQGVLVVASGMSYHNMRGFMGMMRGQPGSAPEDARRFDDWLAETVKMEPDRRDTRLVEWEKAPAARACHPREEHLLPLMVAAGSAGDDLGRTPFRGQVLGVPVLAAQFGGRA